MEDARPSTPHRLNAPEPDQAAAGPDPRDAKDSRLLARGPTPTATTPRGRKSPTPLTPRTLRRITSTDVPDDFVDQVAASDAAAAAAGRAPRGATLRRRSQASGEIGEQTLSGPQQRLSEVDEDVDVEPLLGAAAGEPRIKAASRRRRASSSSGFWWTSALVLLVSCLVSAVLLRGIPGVLPPLAGPRLPPAPAAPTTPPVPRAAMGALDQVQRFLEQQAPGWHEAGAVDLSALPTQPTEEQCAAWGDLPAMQILCSGLNPLNPVAAS